MPTLDWTWQEIFREKAFVISLKTKYIEFSISFFFNLIFFSSLFPSFFFWNFWISCLELVRTENWDSTFHWRYCAIWIIFHLTLPNQKIWKREKSNLIFSFHCFFYNIWQNNWWNYFKILSTTKRKYITRYEYRIQLKLMIRPQ